MIEDSANLNEAIRMVERGARSRETNRRRTPCMGNHTKK